VRLSPQEAAFKESASDAAGSGWGEHEFVLVLGACKGTSALCVASDAGQRGARGSGQRPRVPDAVE
jgi:hypothetical protein